jgi:hypothetical protein
MKNCSVPYSGRRSVSVSHNLKINHEILQYIFTRVIGLFTVFQSFEFFSLLSTGRNLGGLVGKEWF